MWSGTQLLLWGGRVPGGGAKADGAAYDPAGDRWRRLPPAPVAGRFGHAALWTGSELLVWGGATGHDCADGCPRADGLAYRPGPR